MQVADIPAARVELGKILSSAVFAKSPRMSRFLRYVVEQTLEGNGDHIKEYAIGVEVFDKGHDYDPQADSTVRTEATKLRARLDRYYETDGAADLIVITIPKGAYVAMIVDRRQTVGGRPAAPKARVLAVASLFLAAVAVGAGVYWTKRSTKPDVAPRLMPLTSFPELEEHPALSPDGSRVAFAWEGDIYVREIDSDGLVQITHDAAPETWPSWSPDGRLIAFVRAGSAFVVSPLGGGEQRVTEAAGRPVWTPDSMSIVVPQDSSSHARSIFLVSLASGEKRRLTFPHDQSTGDVYAAVSPDGERLAFQRVVIQGGDIYVSSLKGGDAVQLTNDHRPMFGLTWTPDGREIVFSSRRTVWDRLWRIPAEPTRGGFPQPVPVEGAGDDAWFPTIAHATAPRQSRLAYQRYTRNFDILRVQIAGTSEPRVGVSAPFITSSGRLDVTPAFSPDGSKVAFVSDRSGSRELWIANSDGTRPMQLTAFGRDDVISPRWSPDSRQLIFGALTGAEANFEGYTLELGTRVPKRLSAGETRSIAHPIFSRDGQSIIFIPGALAKQPQIYRMPLSGGKPVQITTAGAFRPEESPDGKLLYYSKLGQPGLWAIPAQGGEERQILDSAVSEKNRNWTVAKHGVYFFDFQVPPGAPKLVKFYSFKSGKILGAGTVEPTASVDFSGISVSPDGRWLLYSHIASITSDLVLLDHFR
jgi:Tol biopolymer transport system component